MQSVNSLTVKLVMQFALGIGYCWFAGYLLAEEAWLSAALAFTTGVLFNWMGFVTVGKRHEQREIEKRYSQVFGHWHDWHQPADWHGAPGHVNVRKWGQQRTQDKPEDNPYNYNFRVDIDGELDRWDPIKQEWTKEKRNGKDTYSGNHT